jgi:hypothetical protein
MEYQLLNKPMLFIGRCFLWDPISSLFQIYQSNFLHHELFVDEEIRKNFMLLIEQGGSEKNLIQVKKLNNFFRCGYGRDLMTNLSINWWNQLPHIKK